MAISSDIQLTRRVILIILFLWLAITLINLAALLATPSAAETQFFLKLSLPRTIIFSFLLLFVMGLLGVLIAGMANRNLITKLVADFHNLRLPRNQTFSIIFTAITGGMWVLALLSPNLLGGKAEFYKRLTPALMQLAVSLTALLLVRLAALQPRALRDIPSKMTRFVKDHLASVYVLAGGLLVWAFIAVTRIGLIPDLFWDLPGVPVLVTQVILALALAHVCAGLLNRVMLNKPVKSRTAFLMLCSLLIWAAAGVLWLLPPQPTSTFNPGPFPPNQQFYPNSDASTFDLCAQHAMMGSGYCGARGYVSKPLYSFLLLVLHLFAGQDTNRLIALQTVLFAVFPVILFWIGRELQGYFSAFLLAFLSIFKVHNAIAAALTIWKVSHPRMMMSDFPMAILMALIILFLIWLFKTKRFCYLLAATGTASLSTLVRHNGWILLPLVLAAGLAFFLSIKQRALLPLLGVTAFFFVTLSPWMVRNAVIGEPPVVILRGLRDVVWQNRFLPDLTGDEGVMEPAVLTPAPGHTGTPSSGQPSATGEPAASPLDSLLKIAGYVSAHFFHTLVGTAFTLPASPLIESLQHAIISLAPLSPWDFDWRGQISPLTAFSLMINLVILSLGFGLAVKKIGVGGLAPLAAYLFYNAGTAVARTSGGRYLVPIDWIILAYYAAGWAAIAHIGDLRWEKSEESIPASVKSVIDQTHRKLKDRRANWLTGALFFTLCAAVALPQVIIPDWNYTLTPESELVIPELGRAIQTTYADERVAAFEEQPGAAVLTGRALYPRVLQADDENYREFFTNYPAYPDSLLFTLINQGRGYTILLALDSPDITFTNGQQVTVTACRSEAYYSALTLYLHSDGLALIQPDTQKFICTQNAPIQE